MPAQEVVVTDVDNNAGVPSPLTADAIAAREMQGVRVGETVDGPVQRDAATHGFRISVIQSALHEITEQAAEQTFPALLGQIQVG